MHDTFIVVETQFWKQYRVSNIYLPKHTLGSKPNLWGKDRLSPTFIYRRIRCGRNPCLENGLLFPTIICWKRTQILEGGLFSPHPTVEVLVVIES